mgnify:CR=1 FL=1
MRLTIRQAQNELLKSQQEVSTGFYADIGAELGSKTSTVVDLNRESLRLNSMISNNSIATQRLSASQEALKQIATAAEEQTAVAQDIDQNIVQISQAGERTADGASQTEQASLELSGLVARLKQLISAFRV